MRRGASIATLVLVVVGLAGCKESPHKPTAAARRTDCMRLVAAMNLFEPALFDTTGIPKSDADARHRFAGAFTATRNALRQVEKTMVQGATARPRARLLSALEMLSNELTVALRDLQTGHTRQARSRGYVDATAGIARVNRAQTDVLAACPNAR